MTYNRAVNIFQKSYYFFSRYANPDERQVGRYLRRVSERDTLPKIERSLLALLQHQTAVINLWTEHHYKNYNYLTKRTRKELYSNLDAIREDFAAYKAANPVDSQQALTQIRALGIDTAQLSTKLVQLEHIVQIMRYCSPRSGRYMYRASSSFGRLLRDPRNEQMVGDCNQIVTLYLTLYAIAHDVSDMKLTLYPGHVALHFYGVDIETTNGTFARYDKPDQITAPVHEIVSVNLLDTTDTNFTKSSVTPEAILESARLAYVVSSNRKLVKQNLLAAYQTMVHHLMDVGNYKKALVYARQSKDFELIQAAAHNGVIYEIRQNNFKSARSFVSSAQNKQELLTTINRHEAAYAFNHQQYETALKLYQHVGDREMVKRTYRGLYVREQEKLPAMKTADDIKANAGTIRAMQTYANASGDKQLVSHAASLAKYI